MKVAVSLDFKALKRLFNSCGTDVQAQSRLLANGVHAVRMSEDWNRVTARVDTKQGNLVAVELAYSSRNGGSWQGSCTCSANVLCEHIAAVATHLVGTGGLIDDAAIVRKPSHDIAAEAEARLGRPLRAAERKLTDSLEKLYRKWSSRGYVSNWDLSQIRPDWHVEGLVELTNSTSLESAGPWKFWEHLAFLLTRNGFPLPNPFAAITDLKGVSKKMTELERRHTIEAWHAKMSEFPKRVESSRPGAPIDMRIIIEGTKTVFEWKEMGEDDFRPLSKKQGKTMEEEERRRRLQLVPEAALVWTVWSTWFGSTASYYYGPSDGFHSMLNQLFASPLLRDRLVNSDRQPFRREGRTLHWKTIELENGDYRLQLSSESGPVNETLLALPGTPWFYLGKEELFTGPPWWETGLYDPHASESLAIPRDAVETTEGIQFLHTVGAPLPARLKEKVEILPFRLRFVCSISRDGGRGEFIELSAQAVAGKRMEVFTPGGWMATERGEKGAFVIYTREQCALMPALWGELPVQWDGYGGIWRMKLSKNAPGRFADWARSLPRGVEVLAEGELASLLKDPVMAEISLECESSGVDWFDLQVVLKPSDLELTPEELKLLLNARGNYVRITGKGWRRLQVVLSEEEERQISELGLDANDFAAEPQRLHVLQLANPAARRLLSEEQSAEIVRRADELKTRVTPSVPAAIHASLRPYQVEGFHFLAYLMENRFGGILADDMGLGKTLQALTWLAWLHQREAEQPVADGQRPPPSLVVCPKSVMDNWRAETERFLPSLVPMMWKGGDSEAFSTAAAAADLVVINYTQLRTLSNELGRVPWLAAILDEGQYIKTPNSQTSQAARAIKARHRLVLTGTPIENRLLDLWSLMAFAMPGILGNRSQFVKRFNEKQDPLARVRLSARVRPFLLRRTKQQVARDLPDRIEEDLFCDLEGPQKTLYQAELKQAQSMLLNVHGKGDFDRNRFNFLTSLTRLRQICCHPRLVAPKSARNSSAKLEALLDLLEPLVEEGHKVLVFSQFVRMLELIREEAVDRQWPHFYLTGQTENRGELVADFQRSEGASIFLISLKAGGFGLNLTAASYVVLFDPWWNPAVENQAIDRTHRIGQTSTVIAYRLVARGTIEQKIRDLQQRKSELAHDVLGEEKFAAALTLDDFRFLLEGEEADE